MSLTMDDGITWGMRILSISAGIIIASKSALKLLDVDVPQQLSEKTSSKSCETAAQGVSDAIAAIPVGREINAGDCVRWLAQERGAAAHAEGILRDLIKENFETGRAEIGIAYFSVGSAGKTERFFLIAPGMRPLSPPGELPSSSPLMLSKTLRGVRSDALKSFLQREWEKWARKAVSSGCSPSIWGCLPVHLWKFHDATSTFEMIPLLAQGGNSVRATTGQLTISVQDSGPAGKRDALGELAEDPHFRIKWGSVIESFIQGDASPATAAADLTALCRSSLSGVPGPRFPDVAVSVENTDRLGLPFSRSPSRVTFGSGGDAAAGVPRETDPQGDLPGHGEGAGGPTHVRVAADGDAPAAAAFVALWNRLLEGRVGVPPGTRLNPDLRERLMNLRRRVERSL